MASGNAEEIAAENLYHARLSDTCKISTDLNGSDSKLKISDDDDKNNVDNEANDKDNFDNEGSDDASNNGNDDNKNNKSGKDTSGKRPASSSPAGNVSGQGPFSSNPPEITSPSTTSSNKKARVINESDMDIENTFSPPSGPVNTASIEQTSQTDTSSLDASLHAPNNDGDKGKNIEKTPVVSFPERAVSPDAFTAAVQSQPTKFYASAAPNAIKGFWNHFAMNRDACDVVDRQLSLFSSYGSSARCQGSNELKRIIVHFRTKDDMEKATADPMDSLFGLHFHPYDPSAIKANKNEHTLAVTDIPLFLNNALLRGTFSRFGNITKCYTKLAKLYRTAYITFKSTDAISRLDNTWAVLCGGHCLRICSASFSPDQRKERCTYVALLAGLPRGTIAADLAEIAHEVSAKSINVSFSMNSYNSKPYAYCHFTSQTAMDAAMEISCCNPDQCGLSSSRPQRNPRPWQSNDKLRALYNKHLPPSHPAKRHNRFAHPASDQRSQSQPNNSRTRSASKPPVNNNNDIRNNHSQFRSQRRPWNRHNTEISDALQAVVQEVAALTAQMANMNSRLKVVEHTLANPPSKIISSASALYIPTSMHGWDDPPASPNHNNNSSGKLIDVNSPPTASTPGFTPVPQFFPLSSSVVAPNSPSDMEQRLFQLTNIVSSIMGT
ncbi:hypothetical protein C1646_760121, partial [Rhizophagus diaphanus]